MAFRLTVVGCGDAFGSGGRLQTCLHVSHGTGGSHGTGEANGQDEFLIDCGASSLIGINRLKLDFNRISTIFLTHLHGDHFGGLPWVLLHAQFIAKRTAPLTIAGPVGTKARVEAAAEVMFPGSAGNPRKFDLKFLDYSEGVPLEAAGVSVTPYEVLHASGAPPYALRFQIADKILAFTGDSEWVEAIVTAGKDADLLIAECYAFEGAPKFHMSWRQIEANLGRINPKQLLLTHMNADTLARGGEIKERRVVLAEDGLQLEV